MKSKKNGKKIGCVILVFLLVIVAAAGIGGAVEWSNLTKEHNEARNISLDGVDFSRLIDGTYIGEYEGGMYQWRTNKVQVTVSSGKVTKIELLYTKEEGNADMDYTLLYNKVIDAQTLQVDTISGATLTSKAYLKAIEIALTKAQQ